MKFRISSILWLTLAVACFFAGVHWDDFYERMRTPRTKTAAVQVGKSITLTTPSKLKIPRVVVNDPALVSVMTSPTKLQLTGIAEGTTTVTLWDTAGVQTDYSVTVKPKSVQNFSFFMGLRR